MPYADVNGISLCYEDHGAKDAPAILLIMGLGAQLIFWPDALVAKLVDRGFRVIRFDNRDSGQSTRFDQFPPPSAVALAAAAFFRWPLQLPYGLGDMAADALGLLDRLGIERAHIVGASMGGMIAQLIAIDYPARVLSLTSIMSSSGARHLPGPTPEVRRKLLAQRPSSGARDALIEAGVDIFRTIGTTDPARGDAELRDLIGRAFDRGYAPDGTRRQLAAIIADGSRAARLGRVRAPTLVIHGDADRLIPHPAGVDTARRIPGARLATIAGLAHDFPPSKLDEIATLIADHAHAAGAG